MNVAVDLKLVSRATGMLLARTGKPICYDCKGSRRLLTYAPDSAAAETGMLPAFLTAANAIWREATGRSFGIKIEPNPMAVLGFDVRGIRSGSFTTVMLSVMEAVAQVERPDLILVNDLDRVWNEAARRTVGSGIP